MQIKSLETAHAGIAAGARASTAVPALLAALLGLFLLWGVGFSQISAVHNAGHDTRHSIPFPCH